MIASYIEEYLSPLPPDEALRLVSDRLGSRGLPVEAALCGSVYKGSFRVSLNAEVARVGADAFRASGTIAATEQGSRIAVRYHLSLVTMFGRLFVMAFTLAIGVVGGLVLVGQLMTRPASEISDKVWAFGAFGFPFSLFLFAWEYASSGFDRKPDELRDYLQNLFQSEPPHTKAAGAPQP